MRLVSDAYVRELFRLPNVGELESGKSGKPKKVCVVGGGVAGLTAAYELTKRAYPVTLLEMSSRLGGRVRTHRFRTDEDVSVELGPMRIPELHGWLDSYGQASELGLNAYKEEFRSFNKDAYLFLDFPGAHSTSLGNLAGLPLKEWYGVSEAEEQFLTQTSPASAWELLFDPESVWFGNLHQLFQNHVVPPELDVYDAQTLTEGMIGRLGLTTTPVTTENALNFLLDATAAVGLKEASFLQLILMEIPLLTDRKYYLKGGMELLITMLEQKIAQRAQIAGLDEPLLIRNARVNGFAIEQGTDSREHVRVSWMQSNGASAPAARNDLFDYVICATPARITAQMTFSPELSAQQLEALQSINYGSASKSVVYAHRRPWQKEGITGGGSFTTLPIQQVWYPCDGLPDHLPGGLTAAYMWGDRSRSFSALSETARTSLVLTSLELLHPKILNDIDADTIKHIAWDNEPGVGGGAFALFKPCEYAQYQRDLCLPALHDSKGQARVFFAGEHLGIVHAWIQDAIQTAFRAVRDTLIAPEP